MASMKLRVPQLVLHKPSGQSVVSLRSADGKRRLVYLGPHESREARQRYREVVAQFVAGHTVDTEAAKAAAPTKWPTVAVLVSRFLLDAQRVYQDADGVVSREVDNFVLAVRPLLAVLRDRTTDSLTCADLAEVRQHWGQVEFGMKKDDEGNPIKGTGKFHCRTYVNSTMRRIRFVLRWGTGARLVPGDTWHTLTAFRGLTHGRGGLRETPPVEAVTRAEVDAVLPHLPPMLAAAIELLWWSGMRAGELCNLRMRDVERSGNVWTYRPARHKGAWKGRERIVRFGPQCQAILRPLLTADAGAFVFRPDVVLRQRKAKWREERASKETPSQAARRERNARKREKCGAQFDVAALRRAVHRACDLAGIPRWGLHRLRHAAGTRIVLAAGDDAARVQLGHADDRMVRRYSLAADNVLGREVAASHA